MKKIVLSLAAITALFFYSCSGPTAPVTTTSVDSSNLTGAAPVQYNSPKSDTQGMVDKQNTPATGELPEGNKPDQKK